MPIAAHENDMISPIVRETGIGGVFVRASLVSDAQLIIAVAVAQEYLVVVELVFV